MAECVALRRKDKKEGRFIMKKIILALTILAMVVPAIAAPSAVTVTAVDEGGGVVALNYTSGPNLPRAFALDITVSAGVISDVNVTGAQPFNIYMGTIDVNQSTGVIDSNGTPVAPQSDAPGGTQGGLETDGITIEMGSLYEKGVEPDPCASGLLIKVTVTENCTLSIDENTTRGGIVMEDVSIEPDVTLTGVVVTSCSCFPTEHDDYAEFVAVGSPDCWCYPRQCHGDAEGTVEGNPGAGYWYVGAPDLNIFVSAYLVKEPPKGVGMASIPNGICADFAHDQEGNPGAGYWRVGATDLNEFITYYLVKEPPKGLGVPADCLDVP